MALLVDAAFITELWWRREEGEGVREGLDEAQSEETTSAGKKGGRSENKRRKIKREIRVCSDACTERAKCAGVCRGTDIGEISLASRQVPKKIIPCLCGFQPTILHSANATLLCVT